MHAMFYNRLQFAADIMQYDRRLQTIYVGRLKYDCHLQADIMPLGWPINLFLLRERHLRMNSCQGLECLQVYYRNVASSTNICGILKSNKVFY